MSAIKGGDCTSKKLPHTLIQCEPRQRVNHKAYQYPAVFGEKQEESDQLPLRKVPSVYASPGGDTRAKRLRMRKVSIFNN